MSATSSDEPLRPTPLEIASGLVFGEYPDAPCLPQVEPSFDPRSALEDAIRPALLRPPCLVSFSGGRDSSSVLAAAAALSRREGLPPPIPVTMRFPGAIEMEESAWQERVIGHVRLDDWQRVEIGQELDLLGPVGAPVLVRHGLLWPNNTYLHLPMLQLATGGSFLTGLDGDGLFGGWRWARVGDVWARRVRPSPRDVLRSGYALAPRRLRGALERLRRPLKLPWLTAQAQGEFEQGLAKEVGDEPVDWRRRVRWYSRLRSLAMTCWSFELLAQDAGTLLVHPLLDPRFLAAVARQGGRSGLGYRTAIMGVLFGDLLPPDVISRGSKATFEKAIWGDATSRFAQSWDGSGVDQTLVDVERLLAEWAHSPADGRTFLLLQAAWLSSAGEDLEQPPRRF